MAKSTSNTVIAYIRPWTNYDASQEAAMLENAVRWHKFDVIVVTSHGVTTLSNAITFDRTIPVEDKDVLLTTPTGQKLKKLAEAVTYLGGSVDTNVSIDSSFTLSASTASSYKAAKSTPAGVRLLQPSNCLRFPRRSPLTPVR